MYILVFELVLVCIYLKSQHQIQDVQKWEIHFISLKMALSQQSIHPAVLTEPGQVLLLLCLCAVGVDWMHHQGGLDAHDRAVPTVHTLHLSSDEAVCHVANPSTAIS